jgi:hypothetical protein
MSISTERMQLMLRLGQYLSSNTEDWQAVTMQAERMNGWFTQVFIQNSVASIVAEYLQESKLVAWLAQYNTAAVTPKKIGIVMAGNIPLVGFHDFLCGYLSGHQLQIKLSSKDTVLWQHIFSVLESWLPAFAQEVMVSEMLKGCDAYIATGSNNTARYFEQYFQKYPNIIRKNRTSVAVLEGTETPAMLQDLVADVCMYYGLGCRNVTQIYVPEGYNFEALLPYFDVHKDYIHHNKYGNNYDYQLAIALLNKVPYMTNGSLLLLPNESHFAAISVLHYQYYQDKNALLDKLVTDDTLQCITVQKIERENNRLQTFGRNQYPTLNDYADGVDTMQFLTNL